MHLFEILYKYNDTRDLLFIYADIIIIINYFTSKKYEHNLTIC